MPILSDYMQGYNNGYSDGLKAAKEQAARTAPAARNAGLTEEDACECSATCEDKGGNKCRYITSEQKGALHFAIDLCDSMGSDAISEKLRMLLAAPETLPEAAPVAIYQIQAFKGSWDDCDKSVYDRQPVTLRRIVYKAAPADQEPVSIPEGWQLVPFDPTSAMTFVGQKHRYESAFSIGAIWQEMLDAAPQPPQSDSKKD